MLINTLFLLSSIAEPTPRLFLLSFGVMVLSWLAGVLVAVAIAALLTLLGCSMVWFSQPLLIIPLYMLPSFLAISEVHAQFINKVELLQSVPSVLS